jgi:hypothetical protein
MIGMITIFLLFTLTQANPSTFSFDTKNLDYLYHTEWLTVPNQCKQYHHNNTGLALHPYDESTTPTPEACCSECLREQSCVVWTYHPSSKKCYLANKSTPHASYGAISGFGPASKPPSLSPVLPSSLPKPNPPLGYQPNFVFILSDDQDRLLGKNGYDTLGSLAVMPNLQSELLRKGAIVDNFMVNTPICCPSRTEFFTGRYFHNVGPPSDEHGTCMHADTTIAGANMTGMWGLMKQAGYNVGIFGKTTNDQTRMLQQLGKYHIFSIHSQILSQ